MKALFLVLLGAGMGWQPLLGADEQQGFIVVCSTKISVKPEIMAFRPDLTVMGAILLTKYSSENSWVKLRRARLLRDGKVIRVDLSKIRRDKGASDPKLQPGDIVQLDESIF